MMGGGSPKHGVRLYEKSEKLWPRVNAVFYSFMWTIQKHPDFVARQGILKKQQAGWGQIVLQAYSKGNKLIKKWQIQYEW